MFTTKLFNIFIAFSLTVLVLSNALLAGTAFADGPTDATAFIAQLDNLRQLGQAQAAAARSTRLRQIAVFDHSGQLSALHNQVIIRQNRDTSIATANDFATHLARLQAMGYSDANTFVARLDRLRQLGTGAAQTPSQLATR